jgi:hypothetical protein
MDVQKSIADFVIVTIPGLLLYFLGWAYLSYYLFLFGVNPSELKLDPQTVFISSYVPLYELVMSGWISLAISVVVFLFIVLALFTSLFDHFFSSFVTGFLTCIDRYAPRLKYRPVSSLSSSWRTVYFTVLFFFVLIAFLNLILIPVAHWRAQASADELWSGVGQGITVILSREDKPAKASQSSDDSDKNGVSAQWIANFTKCQNRGALVSVFSDDGTLFLLCRAKDDPQSGIVFEVTKDKGLISARSVSEGE